MIQLKDYWMGRDVSYAGELTPQLQANAEEWCRRYNVISEIYEKDTGRKAPDAMSSGWRPKSLNATVPGAAKTSRHITCEAGDVVDNGPFDKWCMDHPEILKEVQLWQEHPGWTDGWCHLQTVPPRGGAKYRTYVPNENDPMTTIYGHDHVVLE